MKKIENKSIIVVQEETAIDTILALPVESIVLVKAGRLGTGVLSTALHRTGNSGWLVTRSIGVANRSGSDYLKASQVKEYLQRAEKAEAEFFLLYDPSEA